jgi:hypothetical protein
MNIAIIVIPYPPYPPTQSTTGLLRETMILQLKPLFALHPVEMKRKNVF